jgi:hypothetical protein
MFDVCSISGLANINDMIQRTWLRERRELRRVLREQSTAVAEDDSAALSWSTAHGGLDDVDDDKEDDSGDSDYTAAFWMNSDFLCDWIVEERYVHTYFIKYSMFGLLAILFICFA